MCLGLNSQIFSQFFVLLCVFIHFNLLDSSYIKRQTLSGGEGVHIFSELAFNTCLHLSIYDMLFVIGQYTITLVSSVD